MALHEMIPEPVRGRVTAIAEPARSPFAASGYFDSQLKNALQVRNTGSKTWNPSDPGVIHEAAGLVRELDRGAELRSVAARFAAAAGVVTVVALFFFIMVPASRQSKPMVPASQQSDASSASSEITGSVRTALPQSGQPDGGSKPALAEFQRILAPAPASQPATHEQSQQLLQKFLQWSKKASSTGTSQ